MQTDKRYYRELNFKYLSGTTDRTNGHCADLGFQRF